MMQEKERITGLSSKQEESRAYVKGWHLLLAQFTVKDLEAEYMGTNTSVDKVMGISTFSVT